MLDSCPVYYVDCLRCRAVFVLPYSPGNQSARRCARCRERKVPAPRTWACSCGVPLSKGRLKCGDCIERGRRDRRRRDKRRRRALKLGVSTEPYSLVEIADRDGYRCGLCRRRVWMDLVVPHPHAPTVDHIVPLARGGDDTRANVQLAHFICNCTKSDRGTQQLALVG